MDKNPGLTAALKAVGSASELGRRLGLSSQAVSQWRRVPAERVLEVEKVTGIPRADLRPDIYPREAAA